MPTTKTSSVETLAEEFKFTKETIQALESFVLSHRQNARILQELRRLQNLRCPKFEHTLLHAEWFKAADTASLSATHLENLLHEVNPERSAPKLGKY